MPFEEPYREKYGEGDLFYGYEKDRKLLLEHLKVSTADRTKGAFINFYDVGDIKSAQHPEAPG